MNLSNKNVLILDHGLYTYIAQKLSEKFGKVWYYVPIAEPYPKSSKSQIGAGVPGLERIYNFWKYLDQADIVVFMDIYDGDLQHFLRMQGYTVFGSGLSEKMETDKVFFKQMLHTFGLPVVPTFRAEGLDELESHLKGKTDKWLKTSYYRGDFETFHHRSMAHTTPWVDDLRARIGQRAKDIEVLVEDPIESACEIGYDGFCMNGEFPQNPAIGYEVKDEGIIEKIVPVLPSILQGVNDKLAPVFKQLGYNGCYSTEVRITKAGKPYYIDPCCRAASPPSELLCEMYKNYAEAVWEIANYEVPKLVPEKVYGAQIILASKWHDQHELCVEVPKDLTRWVKLKNHTMRDGKYYCIPNDNAGIFGSVIAIGDSVDEVTETVMERVKELDVYQLDYEESMFDKAKEKIESGKKFGINF